MSAEITVTSVRNVLTRATGYLQTVCSHSLQPYRGCTYGNALCGVGCYVQHQKHLLRGREWGRFLEVRANTAESYLEHVASEARWARRQRGTFSIFCSSVTDPFVPQERHYGITRSLLQAMQHSPPDELIVQTHAPLVTLALPELAALNSRCRVRVHLSIESDLDRLPGLPPPAASVAKRLQACRQLRDAGIRTVVTIAPLLPIARPQAFFKRISESADAVVLDHFIGGDGTATGSRTRHTPLPAAMEAVCPQALSLTYREEMAAIAQQFLPGQVGIGIDGFASRMLPSPPV